MRIKRSFEVTDWMAWDHQIHGAVQAFREEHTATPNIMLAAEPTFRRIEMAMNRENVADGEGAHPEPGEYAELGSFVGPDYELLFCLEHELATGGFDLVYDPDPGIEEPVEDEDPEVVEVPRRAAG